MPQISLHIGFPHTGSTTIRRLLGDNRATLAAHGIHYPEVLGRRSHGRLAVYAMEERRIDDRRRRLGIGDAAAVRAFRAALEGELARDLETAKAERIVFSAEQLVWDLRDSGEVARLRALLHRHGTVDRVVVYLRPQSELLVSSFANSVKRGKSGDVSLVRALADRRPYDYRASLALWDEAFGRDAMRVRLLDPRAFVGGSLHEDAAAALAIPAEALPVRPPLQNEGLDVQALAFLRLINPHLPLNEGAMSEAAHSLVETLRKVRAGPKVTAPGWKLALFMRLFEAGNRSVAKTYFGREALFEETPGGRRGRLQTLTLDDAMAITARLWIAREEELAPARDRRRKVPDSAAALDGDAAPALNAIGLPAKRGDRARSRQQSPR